MTDAFEGGGWFVKCNRATVHWDASAPLQRQGHTQCSTGSDDVWKELGVGERPEGVGEQSQEPGFLVTVYTFLRFEILIISMHIPLQNLYIYMYNIYKS